MTTETQDRDTLVPAQERLSAAALAYAAAKKAIEGEVGDLDPMAVAQWRKALIELEDASKALAKSKAKESV